MEKKKEISLSAVALSSRYVMEKISPIIYATVHEDGVWEFWGKEIIDESEILVAITDEELLVQFSKVEQLPTNKKKLVKEFLDAFIFKNDLQKQLQG